MCCFLIPANIPQKKPNDWSRLNNPYTLIFVTWVNSQIFPSQRYVFSQNKEQLEEHLVLHVILFFFPCNNFLFSRSLRMQRRNLAISISCLVSSAHIYRGFTYPCKDAKFTIECWWYRSLFWWNIKTREDHK